MGVWVAYFILEMGVLCLVDGFAALRVGLNRKRNNWVKMSKQRRNISTFAVLYSFGLCFDKKTQKLVFWNCVDAFELSWFNVLHIYLMYIGKLVLIINVMK